MVLTEGRQLVPHTALQIWLALKVSEHKQPFGHKTYDRIWFNLIRAPYNKTFCQVRINGERCTALVYVALQKPGDPQPSNKFLEPRRPSAPPPPVLETDTEQPPAEFRRESTVLLSDSDPSPPQTPHDAKETAPFPEVAEPAPDPVAPLSDDNPKHKDEHKRKQKRKRKDEGADAAPETPGGSVPDDKDCCMAGCVVM